MIHLQRAIYNRSVIRKYRRTDIDTYVNTTLSTERARKNQQDKDDAQKRHLSNDGNEDQSPPSFTSAMLSTAQSINEPASSPTAAAPGASNIDVIKSTGGRTAASTGAGRSMQHPNIHHHPVIHPHHRFVYQCLISQQVDMQCQ